MHVITARADFTMIRQGDYLPRPRIEGATYSDIVYLNKDLHAPMFHQDMLDDCWIHVTGNELKFKSLTYRRYVRALSWFFLGAEPHEVRQDPAGYYGKAFVEQVGSAAYATVIGPTASSKLLADYTTHRSHFRECVKHMDINCMDWCNYAGSEEIVAKDLLETYDNWIRALAIASETGVVFAQYRKQDALPALPGSP